MSGDSSRQADAAAHQVIQSAAWATASPSRPVSAGGHAIPAPASVHDALSSTGRPLTPQSRAFFEPRFGRDISGVRVHTGATAERSAREIRASAYTVGRDIVVGNRGAALETPAGRWLMAHELAHVLQQDAGEPGVVRRFLCMRLDTTIRIRARPRRSGASRRARGCRRPSISETRRVRTAVGSARARSTGCSKSLGSRAAIRFYGPRIDRTRGGWSHRVQRHRGVQARSHGDVHWGRLHFQ